MNENRGPLKLRRDKALHTLGSAEQWPLASTTKAGRLQRAVQWARRARGAHAGQDGSRTAKLCAKRLRAREKYRVYFLIN
jgi:hypothetical protein